MMLDPELLVEVHDFRKCNVRHVFILNLTSWAVHLVLAISTTWTRLLAVEAGPWRYHCSRWDPIRSLWRLASVHAGNGGAA